MYELLRKHTISFKNAAAGLWWATKTQPNFRIHLIVSFLVVLLGMYFQISGLEWAVIIFTIVLGISSELINTALEEMTDLITKEWREEAKVAKDVSAGMMLFTAIGAIGVAIAIFLPYVIK